MTVRVRRILLASAAVFGGLVLVYFVFGWFGFEPLVKWALPKYLAEHGGRKLTLTQARFDPLHLSVDLQGIKLTEPAGKPLLAVERLFVDFDAASPFKRAYLFEDVKITGPVVEVEIRPNGRLNWLDFIDDLVGPPKTPPPADAAPPRLRVRHIALEKGRVNLADLRVAGEFHTSADPLQFELDNLSTLPEDRSDYTLSARTGIGANIRWKGVVGLNPVMASGDVAIDDIALARLWPYLQHQLDMAPPQGTAAVKLAYRMSYADRRFELTLEKLDADVDKLVLAGPDATPAFALDSIHLAGGRFDLARQEVAFETARIAGGRVALEFDADGRPQVMKWLRPHTAAATASATPAAPAASAAAASAATPAASAATRMQSPGASAAASAPAAAAAPGMTTGDRSTSAWRLGVAEVTLERLALGVTDHVFLQPLAVSVGQVGLRFKVQAEVGAGPVGLDIDGLGLRLADIKARSGANAQDWLQLAELDVQNGHVALASHELTVDSVTLKSGHIDVLRDRQGEISILQALQRPAATGIAPTLAAQRDAGWKYRIGKVEARDLGLAVRDESFKPAATLALEDIRVSTEGVSENLKAELPVHLEFRVKQGGRFEASGKVVPGAPAADLRLKLADLSLTPVQPVLAQTTNLVLAGGTASSTGRLRYSASKVSYDGGLGVRGLRVNEVNTEDVIVGWKSMSIPRLQATQDRVRVGQVTIDGLQSKLVIFKDRTINIGHLLRIDPESRAQQAAPAKAKASKPFRVDVERVRFSDGEMDFSDQSLALPFSARIHALKGEVVGLSSKPDAAAQLELDGAVDEFGLARAVGQVNLFDPTDFTDIKVVFRNVEMTSLTPYSATFAGRKIESGKLSLDLEYKIKQRQLAGDNQVVMDQLKLGERVENSTARNLPLDLAIAILQDSDGRIDLGLPVSGSLDDPQFSYGQIIWKAIVNVVTKIVTAPFRALGAMMGLNTEKLDKIVFDTGSAQLVPPEKEKLANLSKVMAKRPGLGLDVHGSYAPKADRDALKELQLRRAVAQQNGVAVAADEEPGPISTAQPDTRAALEKLYAQRFGADALASLQQRYQQANPAPPPPSTGGRLVSRLSSMFKAQPPPLSAQDTARLSGADIHALMMQRLLDAYEIDDASLNKLARQRAEAVRSELATRGVDAARVHIVAAESHEAQAGNVAVGLGITAGTAGARGAEAAASGPASASAVAPAASAAASATSAAPPAPAPASTRSPGAPAARLPARPASATAR